MSEKIRLTAQTKMRIPDTERRDVIRFCPKCGREIPLNRSQCAYCENTGAISRPRKSLKKQLLTILLISLTFLLLLITALFLTRNAI